jgi:ATP-binding cassette subfamily F protein uup
LTGPIVVSHDRYFLDSIVTSTLVFEADGQIRRHAGGYSDWLTKHQSLAVVDAPSAPSATDRSVDRQKPAARKLSYKLQRELDALPADIASLEQRVAELRAVAGNPSFYREPQTEVQRHMSEMQAAEKQLEISVERWAELEQMAQTFAAADRVSDD